MNRIFKLLFQVWIFPAFGKFVGNSTQIITDLGNALQASGYSPQANAASQAPAGPIMAIYDNILLVQRKAQEMAVLLGYLLSGAQTSPPALGGLTAPSGGPVTVNFDLATYNLLVGVFQILK